MAKTKFMVEIESNTDDLDAFHQELQLCLDAVESETELDIIQIELAQ
jgi:hypothetical protein